MGSPCCIVLCLPRANCGLESLELHKRRNMFRKYLHKCVRTFYTLCVCVCVLCVRVSCACCSVCVGFVLAIRIRNSSQLESIDTMCGSYLTFGVEVDEKMMLPVATRWHHVPTNLHICETQSCTRNNTHQIRMRTPIIPMAFDIFRVAICINCSCADFLSLRACVSAFDPDVTRPNNHIIPRCVVEQMFRTKCARQTVNYITYTRTIAPVNRYAMSLRCIVARGKSIFIATHHTNCMHV